MRWDDKEGDLGMIYGSIWVFLFFFILVVEFIRVVVLDCSGIIFVDVVGVREVV